MRIETPQGKYLGMLFGSPMYEKAKTTPPTIATDVAESILQWFHLHEPDPSSDINELGCKLAAKILLSRAGTSRIVIPSADEWIGVGLLERDDELPNRRLQGV